LTGKWIGSTNLNLSYFFHAGTTLAANADGIKGVYATGLQMEYGSVTTPYIKTEATAPVYGNQNTLISLYPSTRGFGASGSTYSSAITQLSNKRAATAWGTLVIPGVTGLSATDPIGVYLENAYNIQGVSAGVGSVFDVYFTKTMGNTGYCVVCSSEQENLNTEDTGVGSAGSIPPTHEYTLNIMRTKGTLHDQRTTTGFSINSLRQISSSKSFSSANNQQTPNNRNYTHRIHFMVFGGASSYGTS